MSVTGHGRKRQKDDFYETPWWATRALSCALRTHINPDFPELCDVLDPCAGNGAILAAWPAPQRKKIAWELRTEEEDGLSRIAGVTIIGDALERPVGRDHVVIMNPPFSLAMNFVRHFRDEAPVTAVLLRMAFLASKTRNADIIARPPRMVLALPRRPAFIWVCSTKGCKETYRIGCEGPCAECGGKLRPGTDSAEYGWFVWQRTPHGPGTTVHVLPWEICK